MQDEALQDILLYARDIMQRKVPENVSYEYINGTKFRSARGAILKEDVVLPADLKRALDKNQIQNRHLPKHMITEILTIIATHSNQKVTFKVKLFRNNNNNELKCEDTFHFNITEKCYSLASA